MENALCWEFELANTKMTNYWETGDLFTISIGWVAERQREGKLSADWTSVQSYHGDKMLTLRRGCRPVGKPGEPYILFSHNGYEAHNYIDYKLGFVEITGKCNAADPKFFDILLDDMIGIQTAEAMDSLGDMNEC